MIVPARPPLFPWLAALPRDGNAASRACDRGRVAATIGGKASAAGGGSPPFAAAPRAALPGRYRRGRLAGAVWRRGATRLAGSQKGGAGPRAHPGDGLSPPAAPAAGAVSPQ